MFMVTPFDALNVPAIRTVLPEKVRLPTVDALKSVVGAASCNVIAPVDCIVTVAAFVAILIVPLFITRLGFAAAKVRDSEFALEAPTEAALTEVVLFLLCHHNGLGLGHD